MIQRLQSTLFDEKITVSSQSLEKLKQFIVLLEEWNRVHNLTGAKTHEAMVANIIDSLFPLTFISPVSCLLDVGTGAGFPGMILAIVLPNTQVVLSEPLKKRVSFLKYVALELGLLNVTVEPRRVEHIVAPAFDLITSRAVSDTALLLSLTQNVSDTHTAYLFYKGSRVFEEMEAIEHQLDYVIVQKDQRNYLYIKGKA